MNEHCYMQHWCTCLSVYGHLSCFNLLVVVTSAAMNLGVQISFWVPAFHYFGCVLRYVIVGSSKNSV